MTDFGRRIRSRREELKISLRSLAAQLGVSGAYLSKMERGKESVPSRGRIIQLANALKMDVDELFALAEKTAPDVAEYLRSTTGMPAFLRTAREKQVTVEEMQDALRRVLEGRGKDEESREPE